MQKTIRDEHWSCSVQKAARKNTKYSRNQTILQIAHLAKAMVNVKGSPPCKMLSLGQKLKMPKSCEKPFFKNITVVLCKKPLEKTPNIPEMRRFWKMGYLPKAIAFAKWSVWVKNLKMPTPCEKLFYTNIRVLLCKKPLEKKTNIREMTRFLKSAILQRLESMPRVYLLQNGHFGSKIKNAKIMQKTILQEHYS